MGEQRTDRPEVIGWEQRKKVERPVRRGQGGDEWTSMVPMAV